VKLAPPRPLDGSTPAPKQNGASAATAVLPRGAVRGAGASGGHRPGTRKLLRALAILLGTVGVLALTDGVLTLVWQEPISGLLAHISQSQLAKSLNALDHQRPTAADEEALDGLPTDQQRMAYFASSLEQSAQAGQAIGRIMIPRIGADFVVVAGTSTASLKKGPGLYSGTSVPGLPGTVGIAGHRTTYLAPFRRINELTPGDLITLAMPYGDFTYTVTGHQIVAPNNVAVLRPTGYPQLVLTACNPLYSSSQRLAVFARLTSSVPTGLALSTSVPQTPTVAPVIPAAQLGGALLGGTPPTLPGSATVAGAPAATSEGDAIVVLTPSTAEGAARKPPPTHRVKSPATSRPLSGPLAPSAPAATVTRPAVTYVAPARPRPAVTVTPKKPASSSPRAPLSSSPTHPASASPTTSQGQTRVQGQPGGPAPMIIGASD
jgi:sortase A